MPTVAELVEILAVMTRADKAAGWDPVGLQVGDPGQEVRRVAVCHEVTESVTDRLVADMPDLVVSYHPLLFRPTTRFVFGATPGGRAWRLVRAGMSLVVSHTDFDALPGGTADALAEALGLTDCVRFGPVVGSDQSKVVTFAPADSVEKITSAMAAAGAGRIGNYDRCSFRSLGEGAFKAGSGTTPVTGAAGAFSVESEVRVEMLTPRSHLEGVLAALVGAHPYEEPAFDVYEVVSSHGFIGRVGSFQGTVGDLADLAGDELGRTGLRVAGDTDRIVAKVAVVPGSGASFVESAARAGADALVTGDVGHHRATSAVDAGVAIVDPGHVATERPGMRKLVELVTSLGLETTDLTGA
ncbi:Nif3-like dinuclear metal center hexameric protein [soil metagenome]